MKKDRLEIEHLLNSTSRNTVWRLIGTAEGLALWIADSVSIDGRSMTFKWGDDWRHHEVRHATLSTCDRYMRVRWQWDDDNDGSYVEIRMERSSLSGQYSLHITDFADDDDREWLADAWRHNYDRMRLASGV